jgi:hypothetical protein
MSRAEPLKGRFNTIQASMRCGDEAQPNLCLRKEVFPWFQSHLGRQPIIHQIVQCYLQRMRRLTLATTSVLLSSRRCEREHRILAFPTERVSAAVSKGRINLFTMPFCTQCLVVTWLRIIGLRP